MSFLPRAAFGAACLLVACGGAAGNEDLYGAGTTSGSSSGGSSGTSSSSGGTSSGGTSGGTSSGGTSGGTSSGGTSGGTSSGGSSGAVDAGPAPDATTVDSGPTVDASLDPGITCSGAGECTPGAEVCCVTTNPAQPASFACGAANACKNLFDLAIPCDDANDCAATGHPGTVCCAMVQTDFLTKAQHLTSVACRAPSQCVSGGGPAAQAAFAACSPSDPSCPAGKTCQAASLVPTGFQLCQ